MRWDLAAAVAGRAGGARALQILCTAAILAAVVFTVLLLERSNDIADRLDATFRLSSKLRSVVELTAAARSAQLRYALTQADDDIRTLQDLVTEADQAAAEVGEAAAFAQPSAQLAEIEDLARQVLALLSESPQVAGGEAGIRGDQLMARMRTVANGIEEALAVEIVTAAYQTREVRSHALMAILGILVGAVAFGTLSALIDRRYVKDLNSAQVALRQANIELESKVAERTRQLEEANADLEKQRDRVEGLLADMNHRVGNSLQFVASFLRIQERTSDQADVKRALSSASERIMAIASAQRRLRLTDDKERCRLDTLLTEFVADLQPVIDAGTHVGLRVETEPVTLGGQDATALCVAISELVTNAAKYAFPDDMEGEIVLSVRAAADGEDIVVEVRDDGIGLSESVARKGGLGLRVVENLVRSIGATLEHGQNSEMPGRAGTRFTILLPAGERAHLAAS